VDGVRGAGRRFWVLHARTRAGVAAVRGSGSAAQCCASYRVAAELVERFRHQRPLRAGALIVTIFGDSIAPRGGAIALGSLIRFGAPFGLNERLVRGSTRISLHHLEI